MKNNYLMPNFLIVGAAKAGTTSIYEYIKDHPDIFMTEPKEPTFFSFANEKTPVFTMGREVGFVTNIMDYSNLYEQSNEKKCRGEASTPYLYLYKKTIENIKKFVPNYRNIKIVIILRNPVDRAYSQYMMKVRDLTEPLSFEEAIKDEKRRIRDNAHFDFFYLDRGLYYQQVKSYLANFNNVKIFLFDDLNNNSEKVIHELCDFLEVKKIENLKIKKRHNISGKPKIKFFRKIFIHNTPLKSIFKIIVPKDIIDKLKGVINSYNLEKIPIQEKTREELINFYKDDIIKLEHLIDMNLSDWYRK